MKKNNPKHHQIVSYQGKIEYTITDYGSDHPKGRYCCHATDESIGGVFNCYGATPEEAKMIAFYRLLEQSAFKRVKINPYKVIRLDDMNDL